MVETCKAWEGQTVNGAFQLGQYLGGGRHSAVYRTHFGDQNPRTAAIKFIPEETTGSRNQLALWQFATTLSHPHLIRVFQTGHCEMDGAKYFFVVMEFAEENLAQVLPYRPLSEEEAEAMLAPTLSALEYLHSSGVAHGRLRPADIMAAGDELKISSDGLSRTGDAIIEPSEFDPPELTASPAGDVWSLGWALVEVLTRERPSWARNSVADPPVPAFRSPMLSRKSRAIACAAIRNAAGRCKPSSIVSKIRRQSRVRSSRASRHRLPPTRCRARGAASSRGRSASRLPGRSASGL